MGNQRKTGGELLEPAPTHAHLSAGHGTSGRYNAGCRCDECRAGVARRRRDYRRRMKRASTYGPQTTH